MRTNILSKEEFVRTITSLQRANEFQDELYSLFARFGLDAPEFPDNYCAIVDTLNKMFELEVDDRIGSEIDYFCLELNFGKDYYDGCYQDENGNIIDFSSAEKLYDHIMDLLEKKDIEKIKERLEMSRRRTEK